MSAAPKPRRPRAEPAPLPDLLHILWRAPASALPFGVFFWFTNDGRRETLTGFLLVAGVFGFCIHGALWVAHHALRPMLAQRFRHEGPRTWWIAGAHLVMSLLGTIAAMLVVNQWIVPGFLGNARGIVLSLTYSLLFGTGFMAIALAINFYRRAMEHAGSERELQLARRIQRSFLLSEFPRRSRVEVHAVNVSSKQVSGDVYDVIAPNDAEILLAIADVSGKGVPAAILSSMLQASLRTQAGAVASPAAMMSTINALACQRASTGQFATFFLAAIHEPSLTLRFTNAGHNLPVLQRASGERVLLERGGLVVGMIEHAPYEEESLALAEGDRIVFYTDGVTEAARADGDMYGEERLYALLDALPRDLSSQAVVDRVLEGVREFLAGAEPGDDITVMALRVLPAGGAPR